MCICLRQYWIGIVWRGLTEKQHKNNNNNNEVIFTTSWSYFDDYKNQQLNPSILSSKVPMITKFCPFTRWVRHQTCQMNFDSTLEQHSIQQYYVDVFYIWKSTSITLFSIHNYISMFLINLIHYNINNNIYEKNWIIS